MTLRSGQDNLHIASMQAVSDAAERASTVSAAASRVIERRNVAAPARPMLKANSSHGSTPKESSSQDDKELEVLLVQVQRHSRRGAAHFKGGEYQDAAWCLEKGLALLAGDHRWMLVDQDTGDVADKLRSSQTVMLSNLAHCYLQEGLDEPQKALDCCSRLLQAEPENVKALRHKSKALSKLARFSEAREVEHMLYRLEKQHEGGRKRKGKGKGKGKGKSIEKGNSKTNITNKLGREGVWQVTLQKIHGIVEEAEKAAAMAALEDDPQADPMTPDDYPDEEEQGEVIVDDAERAAGVRQVWIWIPIDEHIKAKDIDFELTERRLKVGIKEEDYVVDEELWGPIDAEDCDWVIDQHEGQRSIIITLLKLYQENWKQLFKRTGAADGKYKWQQPSLKANCEATAAADSPCEHLSAEVLESLLTKAQAFREEGGDYFNERAIHCATSSYDSALQLLRPHQRRWQAKSETDTSLGEEEDLVARLRAAHLAVLTNLALCLLQGEPPEIPPEPDRALECCQQALYLDSNNLKALFRKGKALAALRRFGQAETAIFRAARLAPQDSAIRAELNRVRPLAAKDHGFEHSAET